jgi:hypothetical protein
MIDYSKDTLTGLYYITYNEERIGSLLSKQEVEFLVLWLEDVLETIKQE